jgi:acetyl/propionyl-CoA carboxylase alpha subunit
VTRRPGAAVAVERIGSGAFRVEHDGQSELIYVAGPPGDRWIFWNGQVFRGDFRGADGGVPAPGTVRHRGAVQPLTAPMPARVSRILARPGTAVKKGETVIVLEAMKMELPIRAPADATVSAVHCTEGELVEADAVLIEL